MKQLRDDEIDVYEFLLTLWSGKWIIGFCILAFMLISDVKFKMQAISYESKIDYSIDILPPFINEEKGLNDFQIMFYSENYFDSWKKKYEKPSIKFEDLTQTTNVDGIFITKNESSRLAILVSEKTKDSKNRSHILIKTNQLRILNDFFNYANYLSEELNSKYIKRANEELKFISNESNVSQNDMTNAFLEIDRYIEIAKDGRGALLIYHPTEPEDTSKNYMTILGTNFIIGSLIGIFLVFILKGISKMRKLDKKV